MTLPEHTRQPLGPNQERWLKALESGEYTQGRAYLRRVTDEFCCLGVACVIASVEGRKLGGYWLYGSDDCVGGAPDVVVRYLALHGDYGRAVPSDSSADLTVMNDSGKSFREIAAIIRSDPSVYFKEPR